MPCSTSVYVQAVSTTVPVVHQQFGSTKVTPSVFATHSSLLSAAPKCCHNTSLLLTIPLKTTLVAENLVFVISIRPYTSPITWSRFPVLFMSFVPTWMTTASGIPRSLFLITLCSCSVLMPFKSGHSVPVLHTIDSPNTKHSPPSGCPYMLPLLPSFLLSAAICSWFSSVLFSLVRT